MTTGKVIKYLRKKKGLTQTELSAVLGVKISSIQKYESGSVNNLKMDVIRKLVSFFNISPWLLIFPERIKGMKDDTIDRYILTGTLYSIHAKCMTLDDEGREKLENYARDLLDSGNYTRK